jgi:hypothetical protein
MAVPVVVRGAPLELGRAVGEHVHEALGDDPV